MKGQESKTKEKAPDLTVAGLVINWKGRDYSIDVDRVLKAFDRADFGKVMGPHARYFVDIGGDLKSLEEILKAIIPVSEDEITGELAARASEMLRSLGFTVLDRHEHHEG